MPSPPTPTTRTLSPAADLCALAHRADSGGHAACDKAGEIERDVAIDDTDRCLIDHGALGECPDHAKSSNVVACAVTPAVRSVELGALRDPRTLGAQMVQPATAPVATPAGRDEGEDNVVTDRDPTDIGAHGLHHARAFVAQYHRAHGDPPLATHHVVVGATEPDCRKPHQDFGR